ncbi:hypothetical protein HYW83_03880 [Candidatus Peregrinibacteria bacterium]|nr:hypothetical protein [Candidatus Peregrinibacteria bacterium]
MAFYQKLRDLLFDAGLSEAEVLIYLELLKKPAETIWDLVQRTGFAKSVVYRAFSRLKELKIVEKNAVGIRALSLKALVADLVKSERRLRNTAYRIKQIAPFLRAPQESIEEFETFYTPDQIAETYVDISQLNYGVSLDFGDFENFVTKSVGEIKPTLQFRHNRLKKAINQAICTSYGPYTAHFCTKEAKERFKNHVDILKVNFDGRFINFFDTNDYVLFHDFRDKECTTAVLIKSKAVADIQRAQFAAFSRQFGNS